MRTNYPKIVPVGEKTKQVHLYRIQSKLKKFVRALEYRTKPEKAARMMKRVIEATDQNLLAWGQLFDEPETLLKKLKG